MPDCCVAKYGGYTDESHGIIGRTLVIMKLTKARETDWVITMPQTVVCACGVSHKGSGPGSAGLANKQNKHVLVAPTSKGAPDCRRKSIHIAYMDNIPSMI